MEEIICDNGKQFMAQEYKDFAAQYGFRLTTSSPVPLQRPWVYREAGTNHQENPHQMQVGWYQPTYGHARIEGNTFR